MSCVYLISSDSTAAITHLIDATRLIDAASAPVELLRDGKVGVVLSFDFVDTRLDRMLREFSTSIKEFKIAAEGRAKRGGYVELAGCRPRSVPPRCRVNNIPHGWTRMPRSSLPRKQRYYQGDF